MATILARELFTATDSVFPMIGKNRYREGTVRDLSHAVEDGRGVALCGAGPAYGPNGIPWPLRQHQGGTAELCPRCAQRARELGLALTR